MVSYPQCGPSHILRLISASEPTGCDCGTRGGFTRQPIRRLKGVGNAGGRTGDPAPRKQGVVAESGHC